LGLSQDFHGRLPAKTDSAIAWGKTNSDLLRMILAAENNRANLILIVILFKSKFQL